MRIGSLLGVPIKLNPWFLLTLFLLAVVGLLPQALVLFCSVLIHEFAHTLAAKGQGLKSAEVELLPFGGVARIDEFSGLDPKVERSVALAGPILNLFIALSCWLIKNNWPLYPGFLSFGVYSNLALAGFNLLPALPLDGGRILRAGLAGRLGYRKATRIALLVAKILAAFLVGGGVVGFYYGVVNISFPLVGGFLWVAASKEEYNSRYLFIQYMTKRRQELGQNGPRPIESILCPESLPVKDVVRHFIPQSYHFVYLLDNEHELVGYVTELEVIEAMFNKGIETPLGALPAHPIGRE